MSAQQGRRSRQHSPCPAAGDCWEPGCLIRRLAWGQRTQGPDGLLGRVLAGGLGARTHGTSGGHVFTRGSRLPRGREAEATVLLMA